MATLLVALGSPAVQINGYTDQLGDDDYNLGLSQSRAEAVRDALVAGDVEPGTLVASGVGEAHPLRPEVGPDGADDPAARQLNRRVELVLRYQPQ